MDYRHEKRPMDVVIVAGLNNVKNESVDTIMGRIEDFANTVMIQAQEHHPEDPSTFCFATLFFPPQFTKLPNNKRESAADFQNKLTMIESLNERIRALNTNVFYKLIDVYKAQNGGVAGTRPKSLGFHKYGMRKDTKKFPNGREVAVRSHRWEHWRQSEDKERMLHMDDTHRAKMARAVNNYFVFQFVPKTN